MLSYDSSTKQRVKDPTFSIHCSRLPQLPISSKARRWRNLALGAADIRTALGYNLILYVPP